MKFYVIRHPLTESNVNKITQGWADSPLIQEGINTAEKLGEYFLDKKITKIYSSDLGRCVQTSNIVNKKLGLEIIKVKGLREQNLGKYNGLPKSIIKQEFDEYDYSALPKEGERFLDMSKRVLDYIHSIDNEDNILIVTHTGCYQSILSYALNEDLDSDKCKTSSLTTCLFERKEDKIVLLKRTEIK